MHKRILTAMAVAGVALCGAGALRGEEILPTDSGDGEGGDIEPTVCAQGVLKECGSITSTRCTQFAVSSGGGSISIVPGGGTVSGNAAGTCLSYTTTVTKLYKDRYKTKTV